MNGQWLGRYNGTSTGRIFINLDDIGTCYAGHVLVYDDNKSMPGTHVFIKTPDKQTACHLSVDVRPLDPRTGDPSSWEQVTSAFAPDIVFPKRAEIDCKIEGAILKVTWTTDIGTSGSAEIAKTQGGEPTELEPIEEIDSWEKFKSYVNGLEHRRYVFRGQAKSLRLRTGFHRTGRADLVRFQTEDIPTLHRHLSQHTTYIFDLSIPDQNGAFLNLLQHHGYPTPLLDWTYSPYVGAFFAYRNLRNSEALQADPNETICIFLFDQKQWRSSLQQFLKATGCPPHFSVLEFMAIDNERLVPQQSISSLTNIDDIESYIRSYELSEVKYLQAIDLRASERPRVMRELSVMGITAGSLFPGLDGACEELRERNFQL